MDINDIVFVSSPNRLPFTSYNEINATIQYDTKLKSLLYGKMMFIETALKNIALNTIMSEIDSSSIYDMYDKAISSYKNAPAGTREDIKKKYQNNKLNLQGSIQNAIAHNDVVYDTRFKKMDPSRPMKQCLILEMGDAVHKFQNNRRLHHPYLLLLKITESL